MGMILHIVNQSPFTHTALTQCLRALGQEDSLILIEDGVLLLANPAFAPNLPSATRLFALQPDGDARGISIDPDIATAVEFPQFVELVTQHQKTMSWL